MAGWKRRDKRNTQRKATQLRVESNGMSWWTVLYRKRTSQQNFFYPGRWMRWDCSILPSRLGKGMVYLWKGIVGEVLNTQMMPPPPSGEAARLPERQFPSQYCHWGTAFKGEAASSPTRGLRETVTASLKMHCRCQVSFTSLPSRVSSSSEKETKPCLSFKVTLCQPFL